MDCSGFTLQLGNESLAGMEDAMADPETEEALAEFDFMVQESGEGAGEARSHGDGTEWGKALVSAPGTSVVCFTLFGNLQGSSLDAMNSGPRG